MDTKLMTVADIMSSPVTTLCASQSLPVAEQLMSQRRIRHLPVVDGDQRLVGLISHRDILRAQVSSLAPLTPDSRAEIDLPVPVRWLMTTEICTTAPGTAALTAARMLLSHGFSCLPVVDGDRRLIGIVTEADFVDLVARALRQFASLEVSALMTRHVTTLRESEDLSLASGLMGLERIRHLPVVDERRHLVGLVTHRDLLAAQHSALGDSSQHTPSARVSRIMRRDVWTIAPTACAMDAARTLRDHAYGCLPVVDGGRLVGIVTEADFLRLLIDRGEAAGLELPAKERLVGEFMTDPVVTIGPDVSIRDADATMARHRISSLGVTSNGTLIGVVSRTDLLRVAHRPPASCARHRLPLELPEQSVASIMSTPPCVVAASATIGAVSALLVEQRISRVFVVDDHERPIGVISTFDLYRAVHAMRIRRPAEEFMSGVLLTVDAGETIAGAVRFLGQSGVHALMVEDSGWMVGLFGQAEALASRDLPPDTPVEKVMSRRVLAIPPGLPLHLAAGQAAALGARMVAVVASGQSIGVLTPTDFARACLFGPDRA